jgi:F-type H+-transporting ATPase subunit c
MAHNLNLSPMPLAFCLLPTLTSEFNFALLLNRMDNISLIGMVSIFTAGLTMAIGSVGPALGEARAVAQALISLAQQPDEANTITRTLFVGVAFIETTGIYCFVISLILIFANPFWNYVTTKAGG